MEFNVHNFINNVLKSFQDLQFKHEKEFWLDTINRYTPFWTQNLFIGTYQELEQNEKDKYKARLVLMGFVQEFNEHFDEIYSSLAKKISMTAILIVRNQLKYYF